MLHWNSTRFIRKSRWLSSKVTRLIVCLLYHPDFIFTLACFCMLNPQLIKTKRSNDPQPLLSALAYLVMRVMTSETKWNCPVFASLCFCWLLSKLRWPKMTSRNRRSLRTAPPTKPQAVRPKTTYPRSPPRFRKMWVSWRVPENKSHSRLPDGHSTRRRHSNCLHILTPQWSTQDFLSCISPQVNLGLLRRFCWINWSFSKAKLPSLY